MRLLSNDEVVVNLFGDTKQQTVMPEGWESEYERYLQGRSDAHVEQYYIGYHHLNKEK